MAKKGNGFWKRNVATAMRFTFPIVSEPFARKLDESSYADKVIYEQEHGKKSNILDTIKDRMESKKEAKVETPEIEEKVEVETEELA